MHSSPCPNLYVVWTGACKHGTRVGEPCPRPVNKAWTTRVVCIFPESDSLLDASRRSLYTQLSFSVLTSSTASHAQQDSTILNHCRVGHRYCVASFYHCRKFSMILWQKTNTTAIWENYVFQNGILNENGVFRHLLTFGINQSGGK